VNNSNNPNNGDLPSMAKLFKSTILAIFIAAIILITVVLPAEYGIDPTGFGKVIGLIKMGEIKVSLSEEAELESVAAAESADLQEPQNAIADSETMVYEKETNSKQEKFSVTLKPNEGKEIKLTMAKGTTVNYSWYTDGGKANFDAHADSKILQIKYHNYEKGKEVRSEGVLEAAFDGNHGWFWRNRTSATMIVTLEVVGEYSAVLRF